MKHYFADLHVHIGRSLTGRPVKMATSKNLTLEGIAYEACCRKGIGIIGIVDCISPYVLEDISELLQKGTLIEKEGGGLAFGSGLTLIPGAEVETHERRGCSAHSICFFPTFEKISSFSHEMGKYVKDLRSCAVMSRLSASELFKIADGCGGVFIPAHVFTPYKSFYGSCCDSLREIFDEEDFGRIPAVELGLSSDTEMASCLKELDGKTFLSNSDAHSPAKIGREYNSLELADANYDELLKALINCEGRSVTANYGLNPLLGKYHRTYCLDCDTVVSGAPPVLACPVSSRHHIVMGVKDRLELIKDTDSPPMDNRPPYHYRVPLQFMPKVGPKTIDRLIDRFGSEMNVLELAVYEELAEVAGKDTARNIILAREGKLGIEAGGGGVYGRIG